MIDISQTPGPLLLVVIVGLSTTYAVAGVLVARRFLARRIREGHNEVVAPIFGAAATLYAVLLGFLVVLVWQQYDSAKSNVNEEASTLSTLYRMTNGMPDPEQREVRVILREYTEAVVKREWDLQVNGGAAPEARKAVGDLYRTFRTLSPEVAASPINLEFARQVGVVALDRNKRTLASQESLPSVLWMGLFVGQVLIVALTFILYMERPLMHVVVSAGFAAFIGLLLVVTIMLDHPFYGQLALDPGSFEHALEVFASVDAGR